MEKAFAPGFRLSTLDAVILVIGSMSGAACLQVDFRLAIGVWFVVGHFFLFCNVLRMIRSLELLWAGIFVCLVFGAVQLELFSWLVALGGSLLTTVLFAIIEVRRPSYHGIGWQRLNPGLPEWWRTHQASSDPRC